MKIKREFLICTAIFVLMASLPLFAIGASYGLEEPVNTDTSGVLSKVESSKSESKTEKAPSKTESKATSSEAIAIKYPPTEGLKFSTPLQMKFSPLQTRNF